MEIYNRPLILREGGSPYSHYVSFDTKKRKTNYLIFGYGRNLPFDTENPNLEDTKQNPKDYDLLFTTKMLPSLFTQKYDRLPNDRGLELINKKVLDVLNQLCPGDFQAFPAIIVNEDDKMETFENHEYYVLNICNLAEGIDKDRSAIRYDEETRISHIYKLILKPDRMEEHHIARLKEYNGEILISHELAKALKKTKIKGMKFYKDYELYNTATPDETFIKFYKSDIAAAKRLLLSTVCNRTALDEFKTYIPKIPKEMVRQVVQMILDTSPMHNEECKSLLKLLDQ
jgi:hypothetical protein